MTESYIGAFPEIIDARTVHDIEEGERFARCHYCGVIFPTRKHGRALYWIHDETLDDGRELSTVGIYCSQSCGENMLDSYRFSQG
jgi:hypothetical protein